MDNFFWSIFEKSGSTEAVLAYLQYNEVLNNEHYKNSWNNIKGK